MKRNSIISCTSPTVIILLLLFFCFIFMNLICFEFIIESYLALPLTLLFLKLIRKNFFSSIRKVSFVVRLPTSWNDIVLSSVLTIANDKVKELLGILFIILPFVLNSLLKSNISRRYKVILQKYYRQHNSFIAFLCLLIIMRIFCVFGKKHFHFMRTHLFLALWPIRIGSIVSIVHFNNGHQVL